MSKSKKFALITPEGTVAQIIVAEPTFFEKTSAEWRAQFREIREVMPNDFAEPGGTFDFATARYAPAPSAPVLVDEEFRAKVQAVLDTVAPKVIR